MSVSKIGAKWTGNPQLTPNEYITIADILAVENNNPGNQYNSIRLTLGNAYSGEIYTQGASLFNGSGSYSMPLGPGSVANGKFTPANTATASSPPVQALCWVRNDVWVVFAIRDVKTQPANISVGEVYFHAPASDAFIYLQSNGNLKINAKETDITNGGTLDYVAMDSLVQKAINDLITYMTGPNGLQAGTTPVTWKGTAPTSDSTAGSVLKADK